MSDAHPTTRTQPASAHRLTWFKQLLLLFAMMSLVAVVAKLANQETPKAPPSTASLEPTVLVSYPLERLRHVGDSATYTARAGGRLVVIVPDEGSSCYLEPQGVRTQASTEEPLAPSFTEQFGPPKLVQVEFASIPSLGRSWELQQERTLITKKGRDDSLDRCSVTVQFE